jgi:arginine exporter protein ArgO
MTIETGPNRQRIVAVHIHATISTMSMATMGVLGVVAGASTAGALGIVRLVTETWFPWMAANSEHRHQMIANMHSQRADAVAQWRAGLAGARNAYRQWAAGPRDNSPPNVVGDEWFEGLRPHLPTTGEAAKYRTAHEITCDNPTVALLSLEIGRVEKQWMDEAKSYPRRARN